MLTILMVLGLDVHDGSGKNDHSSDVDSGVRAFGADCIARNDDNGSAADDSGKK